MTTKDSEEITVRARQAFWRIWRRGEHSFPVKCSSGLCKNA
jgi:hypothetical protein